MTCLTLRLAPENKRENENNRENENMRKIIGKVKILIVFGSHGNMREN